MESLTGCKHQLILKQTMKEVKFLWFCLFDFMWFCLCDFLWFNLRERRWFCLCKFLWYHFCGFLWFLAKALEKADNARTAASSASSSVTGALRTVDDILHQLGMSSVHVPDNSSGLFSCHGLVELFCWIIKVPLDVKTYYLDNKVYA